MLIDGLYWLQELLVHSTKLCYKNLSLCIRIRIIRIRIRIRIHKDHSWQRHWSQHITIAEVRRRWSNTMNVTSRVKYAEEIGMTRSPGKDIRCLSVSFLAGFLNPGDPRRWKDVIMKDLV